MNGSLLDLFMAAILFLFGQNIAQLYRASLVRKEKKFGFLRLLRRGRPLSI
jgi:hypothetical protein